MHDAPDEGIAHELSRHVVEERDGVFAARMAGTLRRERKNRRAARWRDMAALLSLAALVTAVASELCQSAATAMTRPGAGGDPPLTAVVPFLVVGALVAFVFHDAVRHVISR